MGILFANTKRCILREDTPIAWFLNFDHQYALTNCVWHPGLHQVYITRLNGYSVERGKNHLSIFCLYPLGEIITRNTLLEAYRQVWFYTVYCADLLNNPALCFSEGGFHVLVGKGAIGVTMDWQSNPESRSFTSTPVVLPQRETCLSPNIA